MKHTRKRLISAILAMILCLTAFPTFTLSTSAEVAGYVKEIEHKETAPEGYTPIFTREDLLNIKNDLTANYILMNDIDMFYDTISPIGKYEILTSGETRDTAKAEAFSGIFDGNGYALKNLDIMYTNTATAAEGYIGLFGLVSGEIKNLTVSGSITATSNQNLYVGTIAGYLYEGGKVSNCTASLDITGSTTGSDRAVGGFVGYSEGTVEYCSFSGSVSSNGCSGGIVGYMTNGRIYESNNFGEITSAKNSNSRAGGILGLTSVNAVITLDRCYNTGNISAYANAGSNASAGGILGQGVAKIEYCWNSGDIISSSYSRSNDIQITYSYSGGISGVAYVNTKIEKCYNIGSVTAKGNNSCYKSYLGAFSFAGGIVGEAYSITIENVYNMGIVETSSYVDGTWFSYDYGDNFAYSGGIISSLSCADGASSIKNAYSFGELKASSSGSSSSNNSKHPKKGAIIVSKSDSSANVLTITNCYWNASSNYSATLIENGSVIKTRVEALDDAQMLLQESYVGFPFGYKWTMGGSADYAYPEIAGMPHSTVGSTCSCGTWGEWTLLDAATCEFEGTEYADCTTCGARRFRETAKAAHTFGEWTEQVYGNCLIKIHTCTVCGFVETEGGASNGHKASDPIVVPATCTEKGKIYTVCTSCGEILSEEFIPKKGHTNNDTVIAPTCEDYGYTEHKCIDCGLTTYDSYTLPTGHTWSGYLPYLPGEGYALIGRRTCTVCGATEDADRLPIIRVEDAYIPAGNEVEVNILIENNTGFAGVIFEIGYDTSILELVEDPKLGIGASAGATSPIDKYEGRVDFVYGATVENITGNGVLATLTFKVKEGTALGSTPITVSVRKDSSFCYSDNKEIDIPMVGVAGNVNIIDRIKGDVNGDRVVDNRDVARLLQYVTDWDVYVVHTALDTTGDGEVNARDAALLLQYVAGHDVTIH